MRNYWVSSLALLALAGCAEPEQAEDNIEAPEAAAVAKAQSASASASTSANGETTASAKSLSSAFAFSDTESKGEAEREFSYSWPAEVAAIAVLAAEFEVQRKSDLTAQKENWTDQIENCPPESASCASNVLNVDWQVVADTPRYLSLSNSFYTYSGGAHGLGGRSSLIWDRETETSLDAYDFFRSLEALESAIGAKVCGLLNAERGKRRGEPVTEGAWPDQCVAMGDETVLFLGSSNGKTFNRLGVYYAPYIAGPYAEGDFEFTVPVTKEVIKTVKPDYREAFSIR